MTTTVPGELSADELARLSRLPVAVFHAVAMADGRVQYPELHQFAALVRAVAASSRPQDELVARIFAEVARDLPTVVDGFDRLVALGARPEGILADGVAVLSARATPAQALLVKHTLMDLADAIARAYPVFGRRPSPDEQHVIRRLRSGLGLPPLD